MAEKSKGDKKATKRTDAERVALRAERSTRRNKNGDKRAMRAIGTAVKKHWRTFDLLLLKDPPISQFRGNILMNQYWALDENGKALVCRRVPQCSSEESVIMDWVADEKHPAVSCSKVGMIYCLHSWTV